MCHFLLNNKHGGVLLVYFLRVYEEVQQFVVFKQYYQLTCMFNGLSHPTIRRLELCVFYDVKILSMYFNTTESFCVALPFVLCDSIKENLFQSLQC